MKLLHPGLLHMTKGNPRTRTRRTPKLKGRSIPSFPILESFAVVRSFNVGRDEEGHAALGHGLPGQCGEVQGCTNFPKQETGVKSPRRLHAAAARRTLTRLGKENSNSSATSCTTTSGAATVRTNQAARQPQDKLMPKQPKRVHLTLTWLKAVAASRNSCHVMPCLVKKLSV